MQFTSILCEVDKITSGFAGLELIRTGTIAGGGVNVISDSKESVQPRPLNNI
jgi:hypothetical protein